MKAAGLVAVPYHHNVPTLGEWGWWIGGRDDAYTSAGLSGALTQIEHLKVPASYLTGQPANGCLHFGRGSLETANDDINTVLYNTIFQYYYKAVEEME